MHPPLCLHRTSSAVSIKKEKREREKKKPKKERKEGTIACRFSWRCIVGGKVDAFLWTRSKPRGFHSSSYPFSTLFSYTVLPSQGILSPSPLILLFLLGASPFFSFSSHPYSALSFLSQHSVTDERSYDDPFAARGTFGLTVPSRAPWDYAN